MFQLITSSKLIYDISRVFRQTNIFKNRMPMGWINAIWCLQPSRSIRGVWLISCKPNLLTRASSSTWREVSSRWPCWTSKIPNLRCITKLCLCRNNSSCSNKVSVCTRTRKCSLTSQYRILTELCKANNTALKPNQHSLVKFILTSRTIKGNSTSSHTCRDKVLRASLIQQYILPWALSSISHTNNNNNKCSTLNSLSRSSKHMHRINKVRKTVWLQLKLSLHWQVKQIAPWQVNRPRRPRWRV